MYILILYLVYLLLLNILKMLTNNKTIKIYNQTKKINE